MKKTHKSNFEFGSAIRSGIGIELKRVRYFIEKYVLGVALLVKHQIDFRIDVSIRSALNHHFADQVNKEKILF